LAALREELANH